MSENKCTFLLDTGASISIFKSNKLVPTHPVNFNSTCKITGIQKGAVTTLCLTKGKIYFGNEIVEHEFHVDSDFPIPVDGILGLDFIEGHKCKLDYDNWNLTVKINNRQAISIPIFDSPDGQGQFLIVPARSEVVRRIELTTKEDYILIHN